MTTTDLDEIELHDALLKHIHIDYVSSTVIINIHFYKEDTSRNREEIIIRFNQVESISQICNFNDLQKNAFAGHVNYWIASNGYGTTYIYLVNGCIAITAASINFEIA
jgi:hypothetical protein